MGCVCDGSALVPTSSPRRGPTLRHPSPNRALRTLAAWQGSGTRPGPLANGDARACRSRPRPARTCPRECMRECVRACVRPRLRPEAPSAHGRGPRARAARQSVGGAGTGTGAAHIWGWARAKGEKERPGSFVRGWNELGAVSCDWVPARQPPRSQAARLAGVGGGCFAAGRRPGRAGGVQLLGARPRGPGRGACARVCPRDGRRLRGPQEAGGHHECHPPSR